MRRTSSSNAGGEGLIPGLRAKIPHASQPKDQNIKQNQYCNKSNEGLSKWSTLKKKLKKIKCINLKIKERAMLSLKQKSHKNTQK